MWGEKEKKDSRIFRDGFVPGKGTVLCAASQELSWEEQPGRGQPERVAQPQEAVGDGGLQGGTEFTWGWFGAGAPPPGSGGDHPGKAAAEQ